MISPVRRSRILLLLFGVAAILLVLSSPPVRAVSTVTGILASTDRLEYINVSGYSTVRATAVIFFNGTGPPPAVRFLWLGVGPADAVRERYVVATLRSATEAVAQDSWIPDRTGLSLSVRASVNRTDPPAADVLWSNATFAVHDPAAWALVTGLTLRAPLEAHRGSPATATVQLSWVGMGPLSDVRFTWIDGGGVELWTESAATAADGTASTTWTPAREGPLRVTAVYTGADPRPASVTFPVLPPAVPGPSPTTVVLVASAAGLGLSLVAVGFVRYRALREAGGFGPAGPRRMPTTLEPGGSYAVTGPDRSRVYEIFATYVNAGAKGLVLSRLYPDAVRARYAVGSSEVLWLSRGNGPSAVNPTNLDRIVNEIERLLAGREASIVLLDHLDYLVAQNGAPAVAKFLERLTDSVSDHQSRLLAPVEPGGFAPADLAALTRDLRTI